MQAFTRITSRLSQRFAYLMLTAAMICLIHLSGCTNDKKTISVNGQNRAYLLTVPTTYASDRPAPLLLALHQFSDTASGMRHLSGFDAIAEQEGVIVCYPQGRWRVWNAGQRDSDADIQFLQTLIEQLSSEYNVDRDRIYATGISAGGMMAQYFACKTNLLAAVASVAGSPVKRVLEECVRSAPLPVLTIHGELDAIVPYSGGDVSTGGGDMSFLSAAATAARWATINGCKDTPANTEMLPPLDDNSPGRVTRYTYDCEASAPVIFLSVGGGGHTWPGRDNWYPSFIVGPTSSQLDATAVIWDFLKEQRRPANVASK